MSVRNRELMSAVLFLILSIVLYAATLNIKSMTSMGVGPDFAPKLVATGMFSISLIMLIKEIRLRYILRKEEQTIKITNSKKISNDKGWKRYRNSTLTTLLIIGYIVAIPVLGFLISTIVYLFIQFCLMGEKKYWNQPLFIGLSIVVAAAVYFTFRLGFEVRLPAGIFL